MSITSMRLQTKIAYSVTLSTCIRKTIPWPSTHLDCISKQCDGRWRAAWHSPPWHRHRNLNPLFNRESLQNTSNDFFKVPQRAGELEWSAHPPHRPRPPHSGLWMKVWSGWKRWLWLWRSRVKYEVEYKSSYVRSLTWSEYALSLTKTKHGHEHSAVCKSSDMIEYIPCLCLHCSESMTQRYAAAAAACWQLRDNVPVCYRWSI